LKITVFSEHSPKAIGPYSQATIAGGFLFISGQLPIHPVSGHMELDARQQAKQSLENVKAILLEAALSLQNVVKTTIYIKNMNDFQDINEVYAEYFTENYPARACVEVARLPMNALVEIEAIASLT
jgi:2-iminobutanoate/2-iminopropanoate deaminase